MYKYTACGKFIVKKELFTEISFNNSGASSNAFNVGASTSLGLASLTSLPNIVNSKIEVSSMPTPMASISSMPTPMASISSMPTPMPSISSMPTPMASISNQSFTNQNSSILVSAFSKSFT